MSHEFVCQGEVIRFRRIRRVAARYKLIHFFTLAAGCLPMVMGASVRGEDPSVLLAYSPITPWQERLNDLPLTRITSSETSSEPEVGHLGTRLAISLDAEPTNLEESRFGAMVRQEPQGNGLLSGRSLVLFKRRMPSRYSYGSWAKINSGYGQFFSGRDTLGRSRINGVGVNDPDYFYLKMTLSF